MENHLPTMNPVEQVGEPIPQSDYAKSALERDPLAFIAAAGLMELEGRAFLDGPWDLGEWDMLWEGTDGPESGSLDANIPTKLRDQLASFDTAQSLPTFAAPTQMGYSVPVFTAIQHNPVASSTTNGRGTKDTVIAGEEDDAGYELASRKARNEKSPLASKRRGRPKGSVKKKQQQNAIGQNTYFSKSVLPTIVTPGIIQSTNTASFLETVMSPSTHPSDTPAQPGGSIHGFSSSHAIGLLGLTEYSPAISSQQSLVFPTPEVLGTSPRSERTLTRSKDGLSKDSIPNASDEAVERRREYERRRRKYQRAERIAGLLASKMITLRINPEKLADLTLSWPEEWETRGQWVGPSPKKRAFQANTIATSMNESVEELLELHRERTKPKLRRKNHTEGKHMSIDESTSRESVRESLIWLSDDESDAEFQAGVDHRVNTGSPRRVGSRDAARKAKAALERNANNRDDMAMSCGELDAEGISDDEYKMEQTLENTLVNDDKSSLIDATRTPRDESELRRIREEAFEMTLSRTEKEKAAKEAMLKREVLRKERVEEERKHREVLERIRKERELEEERLRLLREEEAEKMRMMRQQEERRLRRLRKEEEARLKKIRDEIRVREKEGKESRQREEPRNGDLQPADGHGDASRTRVLNVGSDEDRDTPLITPRSKRTIHHPKASPFLSLDEEPQNGSSTNALHFTQRNPVNIAEVTRNMPLSEEQLRPSPSSTQTPAPVVPVVSIGPIAPAAPIAPMAPMVPMMVPAPFVESEIAKRAAVAVKPAGNKGYKNPTRSSTVVAVVVPVISAAEKAQYGVGEAPVLRSAGGESTKGRGSMKTAVKGRIGGARVSQLFGQGASESTSYGTAVASVSQTRNTAADINPSAPRPHAFATASKSTTGTTASAKYSKRDGERRRQSTPQQEVHIDLDFDVFLTPSKAIDAVRLPSVPRFLSPTPAPNPVVTRSHFSPTTEKRSGPNDRLSETEMLPLSQFVLPPGAHFIPRDQHVNSNEDPEYFEYYIPTDSEMAEAGEYDKLGTVVAWKNERHSPSKREESMRQAVDSGDLTDKVNKRGRGKRVVNESEEPEQEHDIEKKRKRGRPKKKQSGSGDGSVKAPAKRRGRPKKVIIISEDEGEVAKSRGNAVLPAIIGDDLSFSEGDEGLFF